MSTVMTHGWSESQAEQGILDALADREWEHRPGALARTRLGRAGLVARHRPAKNGGGGTSVEQSLPAAGY